MTLALTIILGWLMLAVIAFVGLGMGAPSRNTLQR